MAGKDGMGVMERAILALVEAAISAERTRAEAAEGELADLRDEVAHLNRALKWIEDHVEGGAVLISRAKAGVHPHPTLTPPLGTDRDKP